MSGCKSTEQAKKIGQSVKAHWNSIKGTLRYKERCRNMSINSKNKGKGNTNGFAKGQVPWNKGRGDLMPVPWNKGIPMSKETKEKMIASMQKALHTSPNKQEQKLIKLIEENNLPYNFVGDFSFILAGKNPDFVNCNGEKKVIELAGRYWHTEKEMQDRAALFKEYGYETLVIWTDDVGRAIEISNNEILEAIKSF